MPVVVSWIKRGTPENKVDDTVKSPSAALCFIFSQADTSVSLGQAGQAVVQLKTFYENIKVSTFKKNL
jgi:hypothetical protein